MKNNESKQRIFTKGNVEIQNIKVGDIHWEFFNGFYIKSKVLTSPKKEKRKEDNYYTWESEVVETTTNKELGSIIKYGQSDSYPHYGLNIYDHPAYMIPGIDLNYIKNHTNAVQCNSTN